MKHNLICFFIFLSVIPYTKIVFAQHESIQDTLVFYSGEIKIANIIAVDTAKELIIYQTAGDTIIADLKIVENLIIHSAVTGSIPDFLIPFSVQSETGFTPRYNFLSTPANYNRGRFALTTNLTSLIEQNPGNTAVFAVNRVLTVEPEYFFSNMSVKIPVAVGITKVKPMVDDIYSAWNLYYEDYENPLNPPFIWEEYFSSQMYSDEHPRNIIYQIGIYTKHFRKLPGKNYFYLTQGISYGRCNLYAVELYHHFLSSENYPYWVIDSENRVIHDNTAFYIRYEILGGLNWNLYKNISLLAETGYSTPMGSHVKAEDYFYRSLDDGGYELMRANLFKNDYETGRLIFRFSISMRFKSKEVTTPN